MDGESQEKQNNSILYIILGALVGAVTGAGAGYLLTKRIEEGEDLQRTPGDGIKIGGSIIAILKQISTLGK